MSLSEQQKIFDKHNTTFKLFNEFEFDINLTLKQVIEKLKEYGLEYYGDVSWGDLITYRLWVKPNKNNMTKQTKWEFNFVSTNPNSEIIDVFYDYPNSADIKITLRKFHKGWFRNEYNQTKGITKEIKENTQ